jgi:hypothetical protein
LLSAVLFSLAACASDGYKRYFGFDFGSLGENKGIQILNYRYGDGRTLPTSPPPWALESGRIGQRGSVYGSFPPGDVLYVKWRVESTGAIYEKTVDLGNELPNNMRGKTIHFLIEGPQLYVYLVDSANRTLAQSSCPLVGYRYNQCILLYPERRRFN